LARVYQIGEKNQQASPFSVVDEVDMPEELDSVIQKREKGLKN
jgi:hypothetical protein